MIATHFAPFNSSWRLLYSKNSIGLWGFSNLRQKSWVYTKRSQNWFFHKLKHFAKYLPTLQIFTTKTYSLNTNLKYSKLISEVVILPLLKSFPMRCCMYDPVPRPGGIKNMTGQSWNVWIYLKKVKLLTLTCGNFDTPAHWQIWLSVVPGHY